MTKRHSKGAARDGRHPDKAGGGGEAGGTTGKSSPKKPHVNKQSAKQVTPSSRHVRRMLHLPPSIVRVKEGSCLVHPVHASRLLVLVLLDEPLSVLPWYSAGRRGASSTAVSILLTAVVSDRSCI